PAPRLALIQGRRIILQQRATGASGLLKALAPISVRPRRLLRAAPTYGDDRNECCRYHDHTPGVHNGIPPTNTYAMAATYGPLRASYLAWPWRLADDFAS